MANKTQGSGEYILERERLSKDPRLFNLEDVFILPSSPSIPYQGRGELPNITKWGQMKLFLAKVLLFTLPHEETTLEDMREKMKNLIVVYAGAAPGINIDLLSHFFPTVTWHLYDPAPFKVKAVDGKIYLYNQLFTEDTAKYWAEKGSDVLFISDIRRVDSLKEDVRVIESEIMKDMLMQKDWVMKINPWKAALKFRLPYVYGTEKTNMYRYIHGLITLQPFRGKSSTECQLIPTRDEDGNYFERNYDILDYERKCFWHNAVLRHVGVYSNPITGEAFYNDPELREDWDCAYMFYVLNKYLEFMGIGDTDTPQERSQKVMSLSIYVRNFIGGYGRPDQRPLTIAGRRGMALNNELVEDDMLEDPEEK